MKKVYEIRIVSRPGFEPGTKSLKGSCSTAELSAQLIAVKQTNLIIPTREAIDK